MLRGILTLTFSQVILTSPAATQQLGEAKIASSSTALETSSRMFSAPRSVVALSFGGLLGGTVGALGGGAIGAAITEDECGDCALDGMIIGGILGETLLLPLGVHLANGGQGNYGRSLLGSAVISGVGIALAAATNEGAVLLLVPVAQLITVIAIERSTSR